MNNQINTRSEYNEAMRTYMHLRYTARWYQSLLIKEVLSFEYIPEAHIPYCEADAKYYAEQADHADQAAEDILAQILEYEKREAA